MRVRQNPPRWLELVQLLCELRVWGRSSLEKSCPEWTLQQHPLFMGMFSRKQGSGSSHQCLVKGWRMADRNWNKGTKCKKKLLTMRTVKQWRPEKFCSIHPWKFSRPDRIQPWTTWSDLLTGWSCFGEKVALQTSWHPFQTWITLFKDLKPEN